MYKRILDGGIQQILNFSLSLQDDNLPLGTCF
jgi:hypothetical protein